MVVDCGIYAALLYSIWGHHLYSDTQCVLLSPGVSRTYVGRIRCNSLAGAPRPTGAESDGFGYPTSRDIASP